MIDDPKILSKILDEIDEHQIWVDNFFKQNWWYRFWNLEKCIYHHYKAEDLLDLLCEEE